MWTFDSRFLGISDDISATTWSTWLGEFQRSRARTGKFQQRPDSQPDVRYQMVNRGFHWMLTSPCSPSDRYRGKPAPCQSNAKTILCHRDGSPSLKHKVKYDTASGTHKEAKPIPPKMGCGRWFPIGYKHFRNFPALAPWQTMANCFHRFILLSSLFL